MVIIMIVLNMKKGSEERQEEKVPVRPRVWKMPGNSRKAAGGWKSIVQGHVAGKWQSPAIGLRATCCDAAGHVFCDELR